MLDTDYTAFLLRYENPSKEFVINTTLPSVYNFINKLSAMKKEGIETKPTKVYRYDRLKRKFTKAKHSDLEKMFSFETELIEFLTK